MSTGAKARRSLESRLDCGVFRSSVFRSYWLSNTSSNCVLRGHCRVGGETTGARVSAFCLSLSLDLPSLVSSPGLLVSAYPLES